MRSPERGWHRDQVELIQDRPGPVWHQAPSSWEGRHPSLWDYSLRGGAAQNDYKCSLIDDENLKCLWEITSNLGLNFLCVLMLIILCDQKRWFYFESCFPTSMSWHSFFRCILAIMTGLWRKFRPPWGMCGVLGVCGPLWATVGHQIHRSRDALQPRSSPKREKVGM